MAMYKANSRGGHKWRRIEGIGSAMAGYDFQEIDSLQRQWLQVKSSVERAAPDAYKEFNERLTRRWAIETGIIEGIYDLDRGVTETLVAKGIAVDYIERGSTNKEPSDLVEILKDHQDAVAAVNFWIREGRPLTKAFICGLHSQILRKQDTARGTSSAICLTQKSSKANSKSNQTIRSVPMERFTNTARPNMWKANLTSC